MTAFRAVRPNRACEARSSSPMYASTSTIRATRAAHRRGVVPDEVRADQRARRVEGAAARAARRGTAVRWSAGATQGAVGSREGVPDVLREQEAEDGEDRRDHVVREGCRR